MRKLALGATVVLVAIVGAAASLYFGGYIKAPEIQGVRMSWGEVSTGETRVKGEIRINNRLPLGLGSSNVGLEVPVEFYDVPVFSLALPKLRLDKGESIIEADAIMRHADLPRWWPEFVNNGEVLDLRVRPIVRARILGRQLSAELATIEIMVDIPLLRDIGSDEPQTMGFDNATLIEIARNPSAHFIVGSSEPARPILTMVSWELHWGEVTLANTQVLGTIVLRNELDVPLPIQGIGLGVEMNGILVIPNARLTPDRPDLPPGVEVPISLTIQVDNGKLVEWWGSHLQRGEVTDVTTSIAVTIVLPKALLGDLAKDIELPLVAVPGFRCTIKTDIMGIVNYRIASAIGINGGKEPEPYSVNCPNPKLPILGELADVSLPAPLVPGSATTYQLMVSVEPASGGTVAIIPPGEMYSVGTEISLTAIPAPGFSFSRWSGAATGTLATATIVMDANKSVVAHFRPLLP